MKFLFSFFLLAPQIFSQLATAMPAQIILIRHGEKPSEGNKLSRLGRERAQRLVGYFQNSERGLKPDFIFAAAPKNDDSSIRSIQTVQPLALALNIAINETFTKDDIKELVQTITEDKQYDRKSVLVCWEHKMIPKIVQETGFSGAPDKWPGESFDRTWVLNFKNNQVLSFRNIPQKLLPGDSD